MDEIAIKPHVDKFQFTKNGKSLILLAKGGLVNLTCAEGHPAFIMSNSFANQVLAQIELAKAKAISIGIHKLPRILDEKVARIHLTNFGAHLTPLTPSQAEYLGVPVEGPYKPADYMY